MRYFLAFSYNMHDSSVSIADEQRVFLVLEAERFFGEKKKRCTEAEMETLIARGARALAASASAMEGVACTAYLNEHLPEHAARRGVAGRGTSHDRRPRASTCWS